MRFVYTPFPTLRVALKGCSFPPFPFGAGLGLASWVSPLPPSPASRTAARSHTAVCQGSQGLAVKSPLSARKPLLAGTFVRLVGFKAVKPLFLPPFPFPLGGNPLRPPFYYVEPCLYWWAHTLPPKPPWCFCVGFASELRSRPKSQSPIRWFTLVK